MLTQIKLKEILTYDSADGSFHWRIPPRGKSVGALAGTINKHSGYVVIYINGKGYTGHRLAWLYMKGSWPINYIDHVNEIRSDNRIENLRDVPSGTNLLNRSKEGIGVFYREDRGTWLATIGIDGKSIQLGTYPTKQEALSARHGAKKVFEYFRK